MPVQKKFARRRFRRGRRTPGRRTKAVVNPTRNLSCIPDKFFTKMVYSDLVTLTPSVLPLSAIYRANSINDPYQPAGGHQPLGHDEFANLYNQYRVRGVAYRVTFTNTSPTTPVDCFVLHKPVTTIPTGNNLLWEKPAQKSLTVGESTAGQAIRRIKGYANCAKILGMSKMQYITEKATSADMSNNPGSEAYVHFVVTPTDGLTAATVLVRIQLIYYVELFERKALSSS